MSFWDRIAGIYDIAQAANRKVQKQMAQQTAALIPEGAKVLDTAAGTGVLSFAAAEKAAEVVCTDLSIPMLDKAKAKAEKLGIDNISFEARNIFDLSDEDETYDVTMAGNVLHLLTNPRGCGEGALPCHKKRRNHDTPHIHARKKELPCGAV